VARTAKTFDSESVEKVSPFGTRHALSAVVMRVTGPHLHCTTTLVGFRTGERLSMRGWFCPMLKALSRW
jgi:hypothetical protein